MLISVIIPTFNRPTFLLDAVRSILSGTHQHFELLIVDQTRDSSTRDALAGYLADPRLRFRKTRMPKTRIVRRRNTSESLP
jgi:glycosyltransferase involved in cell wall biosynthesis